MSKAESIVRRVVALNASDVYAPITRDALRQLTMPVYAASGANGALFGFREPWLVKSGDLRFLTDAARKRLR